MEFPNVLSEDSPPVKDVTALGASPSLGVAVGADHIKRDHESVDDFEHLEISPAKEKKADPLLSDPSKGAPPISSFDSSSKSLLDKESNLLFDPLSQKVESTKDFLSEMSSESSSGFQGRGPLDINKDPLKAVSDIGSLSSLDKSDLSSTLGFGVTKFLEAESNGKTDSKIAETKPSNQLDTFSLESADSNLKDNSLITSDLSNGKHFDSKEDTPSPSPEPIKIDSNAQSDFETKLVKSSEEFVPSDPFIPDVVKDPFQVPKEEPEVVKSPEPVPVITPKPEPVSILQPEPVPVQKPQPPSAPFVEPEPVSVHEPETVKIPEQEFVSLEPVKTEVRKASPQPVEPVFEVSTSPVTKPSPKKESDKPVKLPDTPLIQKPEIVPKKKPVEMEAGIIDPDEVLRRIGIDSWFKPETLHPKVEALVYWRDPKKSGAVFGTILVVLLSLTYFSLISVIAYLSLIVLTGTISFRIYKNILQAVQKTSDGHPFKDLLELELSLPQEKVKEATETAVAHLNAAVIELRRLFLVEDLVDSIKFAVLLWCLTHVGAWFNGMTLVIIAFIALFTLPKVYENNKAQIDANLALVRSKLSEITSKVKAALPIGKKEAEKEKEQ